MLFFCFASFVAFGVTLVLVGANQHAMSAALGLDLAQTGLLSSALALGIGIGVVAAGPLFDRFPRRPLFAACLGATALLFFSVRSDLAFDAWLIRIALIGVAAGGYDTLINAAIAQRFGAASARPMSIVHAGACVGAIGGPLLIGSLLDTTNWITSFHITGVLHLVLAGAAGFVPFPAPAEIQPGEARDPLPSLRPLFPFAVIAFAYVGIEVTLTVFAVPFASVWGFADERGQYAISAFWLGLLAGRIGVTALPGALDARTLIIAGVLGSVTIVGGIGIAPTLFELPFVVIGVALGCVYPLMIALAGQQFSTAQGSAAGIVAGAGSIGGFALPWATGTLGDATGIGIALMSLGAAALIIAIAAGTVAREAKRSQ